MDRIKLNHPKFGICWLDKLDVSTYSIPMAMVYSDKLGEGICRSLAEFELCKGECYHVDNIAVRYIESKNQ